ncbi:MAG: hypothetical protein H6581_05955 [Bacteroidia bacterium]|nr:hypothetical protein [Bacteroidia bacterium]
MTPNFSLSRFLVLTLIFISAGWGSGNLFAQYHLGEIGLTAGGGAALPLSPQGLKTGLGLNGTLFYSHWSCGKRYGYHATVGYTWLGYAQKSGQEFLPYFTSSQNDGAIRTSYVHAGFYFKLRKNEFVRNQETSYLMGARFHLLAQAQGRNITGNSTSLSNKANLLVPAIHLAVWFKRKIKKQAFYVAPGMDILLLAQLRGASENLISLYPHLNLGYTFWNSKMPRFKK